jgi:hypothetical protein
MSTAPKSIRLKSLASGAMILALAAACAGPNVEVYERPDGTIIVETMETKATVEAIDARAGTVTLKRRFHKAKTFKVDENVADIGQIQVGDEVHAVVIEELAVVLIPGGAPKMVAAAAEVALSPAGRKPAIVMAERTEITAEIIAIDSHGHKVTIELPDRSVQTVKVGKHIDLEKIALGDSVLIQLTEAVAIEVTKPN